jgi:hypothetical protein
MTTNFQINQTITPKAEPFDDFLLSLRDLSFRRKMQRTGMPRITQKFLRGWADNCERLLIAFNSESSPNISRFFDVCDWFHHHCRFWSENGSRSPILHKMMGRTPTYIADTLNTSKAAGSIAFDWDAEFDRIDIAVDEFQERTYRYSLKFGEAMFTGPLNDFEANREALRLVTRNKFRLVLKQSLSFPL